MNIIGLKITEIFILIFLTLVLFIFPFGYIKKNNPFSILNPLIIYSLLMIYYCILSPIIRVYTNKTLERSIDFRDLLIYGWLGALVSSIFLIFGFEFLKNKKFKIKRTNNFKIENTTYIALALNLIGILSFLIQKGFDISVFNPFTNNAQPIEFLVYAGAFKNYLLYCSNLMIPGTYLLGINWIKNKKLGFLFLINFVLTLSIFLNEGFRYRIFLLIFPLTMYWVFNKKRRRSLYLFYLGGLISFQLLFNSFFESIRSYSYGVNLEKFTIGSFFESLKQIFTLAETSIFLTTSGIISIVPKDLPHVYFKPLINAILLPIPSTFFENKNPSEYIFNALITLYRTEGFSKGAAIMFFGEYYLAFGWLGIIIISFCLGLLFKKCWTLFKIHQFEELALPVYLLHNSFIFIIITRGNLSQILLLYVFSISPILIIYLVTAKKIRTTLIT